MINWNGDELIDEIRKGGQGGLPPWNKKNYDFLVINIVFLLQRYPNLDSAQKSIPISRAFVAIPISDGVYPNFKGQYPVSQFQKGQYPVAQGALLITFYILKRVGTNQFPRLEFDKTWSVDSLSYPHFKSKIKIGGTLGILKNDDKFFTPTLLQILTWKHMGNLKYSLQNLVQFNWRLENEKNFREYSSL